MSSSYCLLAALCAVVSAVPAPPSPPRLYQQQHVQAHLQNIAPLDYFTDNTEVAAYYNQQGEQKQGSRGAPSRLESLEPDSEVELIPGAQQPQQPPQQTPVSPNLPGLVPGQRVFIVHMPVPGYRPGTIGGYQPIYIVAAAPQGQTAYAANGYQNAVLVNPGVGPAPGQVVSPFFGYPAGQAPAGLVFGGQVPYRGGFDPAYQQPLDPAYYQPGAAPGPQQQPQQAAIQFSQLVGLQGQPAQPANNLRTTGTAQPDSPKRVGETSESAESKEALREEPRRNARPTPTHAQTRNKV